MPFAGKRVLWGSRVAKEMMRLQTSSYLGHSPISPLEWGCGMGCIEVKKPFLGTQPGFFDTGQRRVANLNVKPSQVCPTTGNQTHLPLVTVRVMNGEGSLNSRPNALGIVAFSTEKLQAFSRLTPYCNPRCTPYCIQRYAPYNIARTARWDERAQAGT